MAGDSLGNVVCTLVPGHFFFSGQMPGWFYGPLTHTMRWNAQYTRSLPGQLGFAFFALAYWRLWRPARTEWKALRNYVFGATFLGMLLFWGFSGDGLGRQCLEPLTVLLLVFAAAQIEPARDPRVWLRVPPLLILLALESGWVLFSSFTTWPAFDWSRLRAGARWQLLGLGVNLAFLLALALRGVLPRRAGRQDPLPGQPRDSHCTP